MKNVFLRFAAVINVCLLHIVLLILIVYLGLFRVDFMEKECMRYGVAEKIGITREDLHTVLTNMIGASLGRDCSLDILVPVSGQMIPFFNERDRQHLADISRLSVKLLSAAGAGILCIAVSAFYLIRRNALRTLCKTYLWSWVGWLGLGTWIGVYVATDLSGFIDAFHRAFFRSDTWILNPAKDRLIWLFPKELFRDAAVSIAVVFTVIHGIITVIAVKYLKRKR